MTTEPDTDRTARLHWYDVLGVAGAVLLIAIAWSKGATQGPLPHWTGPAGIVAIVLLLAYVWFRRRAERR